MAEPLKARLDLALRRRFAFLSMPLVAAAAGRPAASEASSGDFTEHVETLLHNATFHAQAEQRAAAFAELQALEAQFSAAKAQYARLVRAHRSAFDRSAAASGATERPIYVSETFDLAYSDDDDADGEGR